MKSFASDNYAGVHPDVMTAMMDVNHGHARAYGDDPVTTKFNDLCRELFGPDAAAFPVFNGTGANVVALSSVTPRWGAVIATTASHINTDECGAPEKIGGLKILAAEGQNAKLTPDLIAPLLGNQDFVHAARPTVVSLTQATEWGTLYSVDEIREICDFAHAHGLVVHMDGARLANAVAATGQSLYEMTTGAGVDVVSLGATKIGAMNAEAVVVLNSNILGVDDGPNPVEYLRKFTMQLSSKMRFLSAQLLSLYEGDLYLRNAEQANRMARTLAERVSGIPGVDVVAPTEVNAVFARLPRAAADRVRNDYPFYDWDDSGVVRWMCSFDTTEDDVNEFVELLRTACLAHQPQP